MKRVRWYEVTAYTSAAALAVLIAAVEPHAWAWPTIGLAVVLIVSAAASTHHHHRPDPMEDRPAMNDSTQTATRPAVRINPADGEFEDDAGAYVSKEDVLAELMRLRKANWPARFRAAADWAEKHDLGSYDEVLRVFAAWLDLACPEVVEGLGRALTAAPEGVVEECPRCASPQPHLHPAVQHEGEVSPCTHPWHLSTPQGREAAARVVGARVDAADEPNVLPPLVAAAEKASAVIERVLNADASEGTPIWEWSDEEADLGVREVLLAGEELAAALDDVHEGMDAADELRQRLREALGIDDDVTVDDAGLIKDVAGGIRWARTFAPAPVPAAPEGVDESPQLRSKIGDLLRAAVQDKEYVDRLTDVLVAAQASAQAAIELTDALAAIQRVRELADKAEHGALRWEDPLPVPEWVGRVRRTLDGDTAEEQR